MGDPFILRKLAVKRNEDLRNMQKAVTYRAVDSLLEDIEERLKLVEARIHDILYPPGVKVKEEQLDDEVIDYSKDSPAH
jgi:CHAD domain-containing protein